MTVGRLLALTLASATAAPLPEASSVKPDYGVVVRIEVVSAPPNYLQPWQVGQQEHRRGTGFIIANRRILTNHHVIEDAVDIRVSRGGEAKRWAARIVTAAPDVDLAIVEQLGDEVDAMGHHGVAQRRAARGVPIVRGGEAHPRHPFAERQLVLGGRAGRRDAARCR